VGSELFLSEAAMEGILAGRSDYAAALVDLGFISHSYCRGINDGQTDTSPRSLDEHSDNARIIKAALCAGLRLKRWPKHARLSSRRTCKFRCESVSIRASTPA